MSQDPTLNQPQYAATLNQSTLRETNLNGFAAQRAARRGYSAFAGPTRQQV
ncbi:hypothetical protein [uncultured Hymenobacter sp.]|uniref:hypothetical protein n=1 Tax=uncultured Hymenobacter sp. TaxID=170016 RepID=UPI0035C97316